MEPDSQTVESEASQGTPAASSTGSTKAVVHPPSGDAVLPWSPSTPTVVNLPQTPQHILPSSLQEAASSDVLGAAGQSEGPASTVQESVAKASPCCLSAPVSTISGALSAPLGSNHAPVDGATDFNEAVHQPHPALTETLGLKRDSVTEDPEVGHSHDSENTDSCTHPTSPSIHAAAQAPSPPGSSILDRTAAPGSSTQDLRQSSSSPSPSVGQLHSSSRQSPVRSGSPGRPMD